MATQNRMLGRVDGKTNFATLNLVIANGVTVNQNDFVYFDGSGRITNSSIGGKKLVGMAMETATGNSGGTVKCLVCIDPYMRYLIDNDNIGTTFAVTDVGQFYDLIGATNAQLVDTSTESATTGQLVAVEYNPTIEPVATDTSFGVFVIAESAFSSDYN